VIQENVIDISIAGFEARSNRILGRNSTSSPESHTIKEIKLEWKCLACCFLFVLGEEFKIVLCRVFRTMHIH
jgi:hypothetical protein